MKSLLETQRVLGQKGDSWDAHAVGDITLRETLGEFGTPTNLRHLDDAERDTLIAHTRQDIAHALALLAKTNKRVVRIERLLVVIVVTGIVVALVSLLS